MCLEATTRKKIVPPIYLDYQASTPLLPAVKSSMSNILDSFVGNPHSQGHLHGREANLAVETARDKIASLIGSEAENVIFTSGATESNNFLIRQGASLNGDRKTILVSSIEHKCVLETAYRLTENGFKVIEVKTNQFGNIDTAHYEATLSEDVALVSIMSANNEIGTITNLSPLIDAAHNMGALFHTDAAQFISHADFQTNDLDADFISFSSHKMYGPIGIGAAYIAPHLFEELSPLIVGGGQQDGKRSGTLSPLLCAGFGEAANQYLNNGHEMRERTKALRDHFYNNLKNTLGSSINLVGPDLKTRHVGNLNIKFDQSASTLLGRIAPVLSASNGSACSSGQIQASHVLRSIGLSNDEAERCVRFSFGIGLTTENLDRAVASIVSTLKI